MLLSVILFGPKGSRDEWLTSHRKSSAICTPKVGGYIRKERTRATCCPISGYSRHSMTYKRLINIICTLLGRDIIRGAKQLGRRGCSVSLPRRLLPHLVVERRRLFKGVTKSRGLKVLGPSLVSNCASCRGVYRLPMDNAREDQWAAL